MTNNESDHATGSPYPLPMPSSRCCKQSSKSHRIALGWDVPDVLIVKLLARNAHIEQELRHRVD
jgi:hypothetical protein